MTVQSSAQTSSYGDYLSAGPTDIEQMTAFENTGKKRRRSASGLSLEELGELSGWGSSILTHFSLSSDIAAKYNRDP